VRLRSEERESRRLLNTVVLVLGNLDAFCTGTRVHEINHVVFAFIKPSAAPCLAADAY